MSTALTYEEGAPTLAISASQAWYHKYGRIVEFQIVTTRALSLSAGAEIASGLPIPYAPLYGNGNASKPDWRLSTSGYLLAANEVTNTSGNTCVFRGVYISES